MILHSERERIDMDFVTIIGAICIVVCIWYGIIGLVYATISKVCFIVENSKYCWDIVEWIITQKKNNDVPDHIRKRFISEINLNRLEVFNDIMSKLDSKSIQIKTMKYSELKHPLFDWHGKIFARTDGNDIVDISDGRMGKISPDEIVNSIELYDHLVEILNAVEILKKYKEQAKELFDR